LCGFIATVQEKDDGLVGLLEANPVTWPVGHSHLADTRSNRFNITGIAEPEAFNAEGNLGLRPVIRETRQPLVRIVQSSELRTSRIL
jgi:hypothetical protein